MAAPQNFRSAFNGFNREDVVNYLSYISAKHETQLNALKSEAEELRTRLAEQEEAAARAASLEEKLAELTGEQENLQTAIREGESTWEQCQAELDECTTERNGLRGQVETLNKQKAAGDARIQELEEELSARNQTVAEKEQALAEKEQALEALRQELEQAKAASTAQPRRGDVSGRWAEELNAYRRAESAERRARGRVNQMYDQANGALAEASVRVERTAAEVAELVVRVEADLALLRQAIGDSENVLADTAMALGAIRPETD